MDSREETVLVTGGSGYIAGWVIVALLQQGYRVRATLRDRQREAQVRDAVGRQLGLPASELQQRLGFVIADLMQDKGWPQAVAGCAYVMHVASPMGVGQRGGQDLIRPAREGTRRVLQAAEQAGVRRVVMTSSTMAAMPADSPQANPHIRLTEETWTDIDAPSTIPYARSKTLAERDAWALVEQSRSGMTLATVLPGFVQGPLLGEDPSASIELVQRLLNGGMPRIPRLGFSVVDVRDLADLHLRAMTAPAAANQRFLAAGDFLWLTEMAEVLRQRLDAPHAARVPSRTAPDWLIRLVGLVNPEARTMARLIGRRSTVHVEKAERLLGWKPRPAADSIVDCARSLIAEGVV